MKDILKSTLALLVAALTLTVTGCSDDDDARAAGPSSSSSFAGTTITFNPTIEFLAGDNLLYTNTDNPSPFPAAATATPGTYTYTPNASYTAGTLTIIVDGSSPFDLEISNFRRSGTNVTGFTARYNGTNYPVTVTGTLPAYQPPTGGGGGGSSLVDATTDIASAVQGTYELAFFNAFGGSQVPGSPHDAGDTVTFVIGARTLQVGTKTLSNPKNPTSMPSAFVYQDGSLWYWVYGDTPVHINLYGGIDPTQAGTTFYGGFDEGENGSGGNGGDNGGDSAGNAGTYTSVFSHISYGLPAPSSAPANGATVNFTVSSDLQTLTFNGRTLPLSGDSRPVSLSYTDATTSPTNNVQVTLFLNEGGVVTHYTGQYFASPGSVPPTPDVLAFESSSVTKQ